MPKRYIGDGVFIDHDQRGLVLTTSDGFRVTNQIILEPDTWESLQAYVKSLEIRVTDDH